MPLIVLTGGARSGKSRAAEQIATRLSDDRASSVVFIATATIQHDEEMRERIERHRQDRPSTWQTIEAPSDLVAALQGVDPDATVIIDCLTLWATNLMLAGSTTAQIEGSALRTAMLLSTRRGTSICVTNEVGLGIVPGNQLSRAFRDVLGRVNAIFAQAADTTLFMSAGKAFTLQDPLSLLGFD